MTASEVIARAAARWPHACDESVQRALLDRLDRLARAQIPGLPAPGEEADALAVPAPYDGLYEHYLVALLAQMEGENVRYNNEMALFNSLWDDCARYYRRTHLPEKEVRLHVPV